MKAAYRRILPAISLLLPAVCLLAQEKQSSPAPDAADRARAMHWAFRPPARPASPSVSRPERIRTEIDRFIQSSLEAKSLALGPEADRGTLLRRVAFDLIGLPPTPAEIEAYLADTTTDASERMVDRYLASPHYGERWGKYWLDAAGYADSNGYFNADSDRPLAYRYRDYVIRAFNDDKPYDRFVREQLAGDELVGFEPDGDVLPEMIDSLVATHFLRNAPDGTGESDGNPDEVRIDRYTVIEGTLQVTMSSLLGVTIQCARCHDHKFEPITQQEYYSLQAVFFPAYSPDRWIKPNDRAVAIGTRAHRDEHQRLTERSERQIQALKASLESIAAPLREQLAEERLKDLEPAKRVEVVKAFTTPKDKRSPEQEALLKSHAEALKISDDDIANRFAEYAAVREQVRKAITEREKERPPPLEKIAALTEKDPEPLPHHVLVRGQHNTPGAEVGPGVPAALCTNGNEYRLDAHPPGRVSTGRRTALARWVTSPENPLFARVMVNRIWQQHFGTGLVATSDNLGQSGAKPSHPELLDYLATEFVRGGWSVKAMHRLIMKSAVYRQASEIFDWRFSIGDLQKNGTESNRKSTIENRKSLDPDNRLLWRFPVRRLDAEAVRDAMLAVAGELDGRAGGPYVATRRVAEGSVEVDEKLDGAKRRSVYLQQRRTQVLTMLELFDAPSIVGNCTFRGSSTVPLQSLAMLNSEFVRLRAESFAKRLERDAGLDDGVRIRTAFLLACGRGPTDDERAASQRFVTSQRQLYGQEKDGEQRAWTDFCQMLLGCNALLYVE